MTSRLDRWFRFLCAAQAGAQLFFIAAAQIIFSKEVASLPHEHPRRQAAADLIGQLLMPLDTAALITSGAAVAMAFFLSRRGESNARRALFPLLAGLCALASIFGTTPSIQAMRMMNRTSEAAFGRMHALSSLLLLAGIVFFVCSALVAAKPTAAKPQR